MDFTSASRARLRTVVAAGVLCGFVPFFSGQTPPFNNRSHPFGPGECGPADPAYIHTANETGGIPLFLQPSEAAKAFHLIRESTRPDVATVLWATGSLDAKPHDFSIPVDSFSRRITVTFSTDTKGTVFKLMQPSGKVTAQGAPGTEFTDLNCGRIVTVSSPEAGEWRGEISGTGRFWVEAQAQSEIYFVAVEFVRKAGRPGHEGLFRIQGQPVTGTPATLQVSVSASATSTTDFHLVNELGHAIQKLQMRPVNTDREFLELVGSVNLPSVPFRVAMTGRDANGREYQRFFSTLFHAESVQVSAKLEFDELAPGGTGEIAFIVENAGPQRTFHVTVTDAHQFVSSVEPADLTLGAGKSAIVRVNLKVPSDAAPGTGDDIVIVAASTSGPQTSNSNVVHLSISSAATNQKP